MWNKNTWRGNISLLSAAKEFSFFSPSLYVSKCNHTKWEKKFVRNDLRGRNRKKNIRTENREEKTCNRQKHLRERKWWLRLWCVRMLAKKLMENECREMKIHFLLFHIYRETQKSCGQKKERWGGRRVSKIDKKVFAAVGGISIFGLLCAVFWSNFYEKPGAVSQFRLVAWELSWKCRARWLRPTGLRTLTTEASIVGCDQKKMTIWLQKNARIIERKK